MTAVISESGLYSLILSSKKAEAKAFYCYGCAGGPFVRFSRTFRQFGV